jgi:hypothetical protein
MFWLIGRGLVLSSGVVSVGVLCAAGVVVCDRSTQRLEREAKQVDADRRVRAERDAAVMEANAERSRRLAAEAELLALKLQMDTIRRDGVFFPKRPEDVAAVDLIPPQNVPTTP